MSLANLLKKGSLRGFATATPATVATVKPLIPPSVASVATVNVANPQNPAANDPAPTPKAAAVNVDLIPQQGDEVSTTLAIDPDRWPQSPAITSRDTDTFTARLARFTAKGLTHTDGEALADKLVQRDRESDDRRLCLECSHLSGRGAGSWQCRNWQRAGIAIKSRDAGLPDDLVRLLQRCNGFTNAINQL